MESLFSLCNEIKGCKRCDLHFSRKTAVCGIGDNSAEVMIVGEAPGSNEDQAGIPFVGRSGKLLDKMLIETGLPRSSVYITNAVRCRPKIGRMPKITEIRKCTPFLSEEINMVDPLIIIPMGNSALKSLGIILRINFGRISEAQGNIYQANDRFILPQFHPAAILRNPKLFHTVQDRFETIRNLKDDIGKGKSREYICGKYGIIKI